MKNSVNIRLDRIDVPKKYIREKSEDLTREQSVLTRSIKAVGLQFPITVKESGKRYVLVDGVRRYNAFRAMRSEAIACHVIPESDTRDMDIYRFQVNVQRENLKPMDEVDIIRQLEAEGWKRKDLADAIGKKPNTIARLRDCLNVNAKWQRLVNNGTITLRDVQVVAALSHVGQRYLYKEIVDRRMPFNGSTIGSMTRAMDPIKHREWFNRPAAVASHRINERTGHPFKMKKVEGVARMKVFAESRQRTIKVWEEEMLLVTPVIKKVMETTEVWEDLPPRTQNAFKEFASVYLK